MGRKQFCPVCNVQAGCGTFLCRGCRPNRWVHPKCGGYNQTEVQIAAKSGKQKSLRCNKCKKVRPTEAKNNATFTALGKAKTRQADQTSPSDIRMKCPVCNQYVGCGAFMCQGCQPNQWVHPRCGGYRRTEVQIAGKSDAKSNLRCNNCKEGISLAVQNSREPSEENMRLPDISMNGRVTASPPKVRIQLSHPIKSSVSTSVPKVAISQPGYAMEISNSTLSSNVNRNQSGVHGQTSLLASLTKAKRSVADVNVNHAMALDPMTVKTSNPDHRLRCPVCSGKVGCGAFLCVGCQPNKWVHPKCGGYNSTEVQVAGKTAAKNNLRCNNCKEVGNSEVEETSTLNLDSIISQLHFCVKCKDNFQSYGRMVAHTKHCMVKYKKEKLDYEEIIHDARVPEVYSCDQCDEKFHYYKHLMAHKKICSKDKEEEDSNEETDDSDTDDVCFNNELRSEIYNLIHRSIVESKNNKLRVAEVLKKPYSKMIWKTFAGNVNNKEINSGEKQMEPNTARISFECDVCGKNFSRKDTLNRHFKLFHTKPKVDIDATQPKEHGNGKLEMKVEGRKLFYCQICKKCFNHRENLAKHKEMHRKDRSNANNVSTKPGIKSKKDHKQEQNTNPGTHCCKYCGKCCINNTELQAHIRVHTGEKPFCCDVCGKCFIRKHHLTDHINGVHLKLRPYSCNLCKKSFFRSSQLNEHMKIHGKGSSHERSYKCNTCRKCFSNKNIFNTHVRSHRIRKNSEFFKDTGGDKPIRARKRSPQV